MVRLSSVFLPILILAIWSCGDDEIQTQFYGYQIERLLSSGDTAVWIPISVSGEGQMLSSCADSVHLFIRQDGDSLDIRDLTPRCDGSMMFDTGEVRMAKASVEDIFFTDSLLFADGTFWIVTESFSLTMGYQDGDVNYRYAIVEQ